MKKNRFLVFGIGVEMALLTSNPAWADPMVLFRSPLTPSAPSFLSPKRVQDMPRQVPTLQASVIQTPRSDEKRGLNWILDGIAMVESRHGNNPWPWTLNVAGKPYFFIDRESAWNAAQSLTHHQIDNFDIGLMQVNWHYHHHRFKSTWDALDPKINQRVAETILREQWEVTGHLPSAIARYHSANPKLGIPYLRKVISAMNELENKKTP
jgi:hypothetical protein